MADEISTPEAAVAWLRAQGFSASLQSPERLMAGTAMASDVADGLMLNPVFLVERQRVWSVCRFDAPDQVCGALDSAAREAAALLRTLAAKPG